MLAQQVLNIVSSGAFYHKRGSGAGVGVPPLDREELMRRQYAKTGADEAMPDGTDFTSTPWTTSDIFFLAFALGRLRVTKGTVSALKPGMVMVDTAAGGAAEIPSDIVIKNLGFSGVDVGDRMGGVCDVVGHRSCRPPIWITERVLTFRHQTDLPRDLSRAEADRLGEEALEAELAEETAEGLRQRAEAAGLSVSEDEAATSLRRRLYEHLDAGAAKASGGGAEDWRGGGEQGGWVGPNWVGSAPHGTGVWTELFLHFRRHPEALRDLFRRLPRTALSATGGADIGRGMRTTLDSDAELLARVNANRRTLNSNTFKYYAAPGASPQEAQETWVLGFLRRNRQDWEDACATLTGDRRAVPYLWEGVAQELGLEPP